MARHVRLGSRAHSTIERAVDLVFDRLKAHFLGPGAKRFGPKRLEFTVDPKYSLTALFDASAQQEGVAGREEVQTALLKVAGSYIDAQREKTKARVAQQVQAFLTDAQSKGVKTDVATVLGGQLSQVFTESKKEIARILETEATTVRNTSIFDAIGRIGTAIGSSDPTCFFVVVRDDSCCDECLRLHMQPDGITPKVYKMSELGGGYHKRGQDAPKIGGLHPNCRCVLTHLIKGYGFDSDGRVTYKQADHDEYDKQRNG